MPSVADRTQGKALRLLELAYQLLLANAPKSAESLQEAVLGYEVLGADTESQDRTFERDKDDLRDLGVRLRAQPLYAVTDSESAVGYRAEKARFLMPEPTRTLEWEALRGATGDLQRVADALPGMDRALASEAALGLLPFKRDLGIRMPAIDIPPRLRNTAAHLIEWTGHLFVDVVREGKATGRERAPMTADNAGALIGMPADLVWAMVERAVDRPVDHRTHVRQKFRVEAPEPESRELTVVAPSLKHPWRPRPQHVDALLAAAAESGVVLSEAVVSAFRSFQR
jgi:hypothetical protein